MTPNDIIRMARQAGFQFTDKGHGPDVLHTEALEYSSRCFERFASFVAEAERQRWEQACKNHYTDYVDRQSGAFTQDEIDDAANWR